MKLQINWHLVDARIQDLNITASAFQAATGMAIRPRIDIDTTPIAFLAAASDLLQLSPADLLQVSTDLPDPADARLITSIITAAACTPTQIAGLLGWSPERIQAAMPAVGPTALFEFALAELATDPRGRLHLIAPNRHAKLSPPTPAQQQDMADRAAPNPLEAATLLPVIATYLQQHPNTITGHPVAAHQALHLLARRLATPAPDADTPTTAPHHLAGTPPARLVPHPDLLFALDLPGGTPAGNESPESTATGTDHAAGTADP